MTVFLNLLFIFVSVLFFAGRMYEVMYLLEEGTHFLVSGGIVTTPLMMGIIALIAVCCGVLAFAGKEREEENLKFPVGLFGIAPAPFIVIASILNIIGIFKTGGFLGYDIMMILAAVGLAMLGIMNIKGKKRERLPVFMVMLLPLAMCMNAVVLTIQPIANTMFLYYGLSAITVLMFLLMLLKNAYAPSDYSQPVLYVSALINFVICGAANLANLIGGLFSKALSMADIMLYVALAIIGVYSLFIAFYIMPSAQQSAPAEKPQKKAKKRRESVYEDEAEEEEYVSDFLPKPSQISASANSVWQADSELQQTDKISQETLAALFARKDEREHRDAVNTAVKEATVELAVTQAVEKHTTTEFTAEETKVISFVQPKPQKTEKTLFKGSGKKETSGKVVYKAPKK